jgi:hypothetical protein
MILQIGRASVRRVAMLSEQWSRNYEDILAFAKTRGHLKLPSADPISRRLASWLRIQKRRVKLLDYQKEKLDILLSTTYRPNQKPEKRENRRQGIKCTKNLLAFRDECGDFVVSIKNEKPSYQWILRQR